MKPYHWFRKRAGKIHPANECGICGENGDTKGGRRQFDKRALIDEVEIVHPDITCEVCGKELNEHTAYMTNDIISCGIHFAEG
jgi:hypothetical protein